MLNNLIKLKKEQIQASLRIITMAKKVKQYSYL